MPLSAGQRLGPYEIVAFIGAGGMGDVYRARDPRLGRDVAIKVLPAAFSADADRLRRFEQEARAAAALNHPNILAVYDIGTHGDAPFIVSELLEGETLREQLDTGPVAVRKTAFDEIEGRFSPDGKWVAYVSNQSGINEVYVRGFATDFSSGSASVGSTTLISRGGGTAPRWRRDGRELFYLAPNGKMMAVDVKGGPAFEVGPPTALFETPPGAVVGDVTPDGKRFLLVTPEGPSASAPFTVVLNWIAGLKQ